jgi:lysophospholipase L1-like esterase
MRHRRPPVRILLLGHSYVRRLHQFMAHKTDRKNLGFNPTDVNVSCLFISGASVRPGSKSIYQLIDEVSRRRPDIVYIHVGENDVGNVTPDELTSLIVGLRQRINHANVIVSQLLPFPRLSGHISTILLVNDFLQRNLDRQDNTTYWKHRGGFWLRPASRNAVYANDRTHLTANSLQVYWSSVRAAVGRVLCRV